MRHRALAGRTARTGLLGKLVVAPVRIMVVVLALVLFPTLICYQLLIGLVDRPDGGSADLEVD